MPCQALRRRSKIGMLNSMVLRIFCQSQGTTNSPRLVADARRLFALELDLAAHHDHVVVASVGQPSDTAELRQRNRQPTDLEAAERAERNGSAAGMAGLAARCPFVVEVVAAPASSQRFLYRLAATLAFVGLGPVLPEDESTLYGVRSALALAEKS